MALNLECKTRPAGTKPNALRRSGMVPAVLYGHKGTESIDLTVEAKAAEILVRDASVDNTLIQISVPEISWSGKALLREIQSHPWKKHLYHLSFFSVESHAFLDAVVPVRVVGESSGIKMGGGSIDLAMSEMRVRCAPDSIPASIDIDATDLNMGSSLHVSDINLPEGVIALEEPSRIVIAVFGSGEADTKTSDTPA